MIDADKIHRVLASQVRRNILNWLKDPAASFPGAEVVCSGGVPIGMIQARTRLSQSTVSAHLSALIDAGLLKSHRVGQWAFISRDEGNIRQVVAYLTEALS
jgi:DNA-binding transcriptional ArsR family regulator